jgi:diguanylate cyclase (GGDEF)-like protein/PAS domain S-box-containing protein
MEDAAKDFALRSARRFATTAALWLLLASMTSIAQSATRRYYFDNLGSEQGLAQNTVNALLQDHAGYMWIASQGGLQRYDGYAFRLYANIADDAHSLPENFVTTLAEDDRGRLWVGTNTSGLARLNPAEGRVERFGTREMRAGETRANSIAALRFDAKQGLWVGSREGIDLFDPETGKRQPVFRFEPNGLPLRPMRRFVADGARILWAPTHQGLLRIDRETLRAERASAPELASTLSALRTNDGRVYVGTNAGLFRVQHDGVAAEKVWPTDNASYPVSDIVEGPRGRLWLAVRGEGLVILDPANGQTEWLRHNRNLPGSLPEEQVSNLLLDRSGLLWVGGSVRGVATTRPDGAALEYVSDLAPHRDLTIANNIGAVWSDGEGFLWLGTEGDGLKRYDRAKDEFEDFTEPLTQAGGLKAPNELRIFAIRGADGGRLWIATHRGLFQLDPKTRKAQSVPLDLPHDGPEDQEVRTLLTERDGSLWVGTRQQGLMHLWPATKRAEHWRHDDTDPQSLAANMVMALTEDSRHRLWIGTLDGLSVLEPDSGKLSTFRHEPARVDSLSGNLVRTIHESSSGAIWVGTHSGLSRLDRITPTGASFSRVSSEAGIISDTIYGILEDSSGSLWLSTNRGLSRYEPVTGKVRNFALKDGLQALEFNGGASAPGKEGELLFGGTNGLNVVRPEALSVSRFVPPVVINAATVGTERHEFAFDDAGALSMPQAARLVRFEFAALDFTAPERNRFSYRLEGFDENWVDAGARHEATYTNLDAGHYALRVRAANADGVWNEAGTSLTLDITPVWWATWWMKTLYGLLAFGIVAMIWRDRAAKRAEELRHRAELREREDRLRLALWGSEDEFWDFDMRAGRLYRLGADQLLGGHREEDLTSEEWLQGAVHPDDIARVRERLDRHLNGEVDHFESEHRIRTADGEWIWVLSRGKLVERAEDGTPLRLCGTAHNITASRAADRERRIAAEVIRNMTEAVTVTDLSFNFTSCNLAFTRITGFREEEIIGKDAALLNSGQHPNEVYVQMRQTLLDAGHWRGELWQIRKDGEEFLCWLELSEVRDAQGLRTHYVGVLTDITDRKRAEQELRYLANYDTLTGLPNRTLLGERLGHAIIRARRNGRKVAVLFLDLDRFKHVNDSMGHAAGDRMLKAAGSRLRNSVREADTVARLGGDEFTVILEDVVEPGEGEAVALKLLEAFTEPLELDTNQEVVISPSIGIALYPDHGMVPTDLLKFADTAMYQAKERGRNTYMVYTSEMDAAARRRAVMIAALRRALERRELHLVFQPKQSLVDQRIFGVEALLRWNSDELGPIPPNIFIPLAEETGQIIEIGEFVLDSACATLARWRTAGVRDLVMAVNLSVLQLRRGEITRRLCEILAEHDISPDQIELELTESTVMGNAEESVRTLGELKSVGVSLAIDDFGTGYSSLSYLKRLPIDTLKIDKEFVGDITSDPDDEAITATIITMAHSLGLNVVAEGVETAEQMDYLRQQGCDAIQGNWLSLPLSEERCLAFLLRDAPKLAVTAPVRLSASSRKL